MSKYIIEIPDDAQYVLINGKAEHKYYTAVHPIAELEELNSDYINEHYFGGLQDESYQRGLDDAWWAAKKLFGYKNDGGISIEELGNVFGYGEDELYCTADIIRHNTASEAIAKLKAYEEKQKAEDEIKVGDVVKPCENVASVVAPFVVTKVDDEHVWGVDSEGSWNYWRITDVIKTDKHFDIESILKEIRS